MEQREAAWALKEDKEQEELLAQAWVDGFMTSYNNTEDMEPEPDQIWLTFLTWAANNPVFREVSLRTGKNAFDTAMNRNRQNNK